MSTNVPAVVPPRKPRHDGWTLKRQQRFIAALAEHGIVSTALKVVKLAPASAYDLRRRSPEFAAAWDAALEPGLDRLEDRIMDHALNGVPTEVWYAGAHCGHRRVHQPWIALAALRAQRPAKWGAGVGGAANANVTKALAARDEARALTAAIATEARRRKGKILEITPESVKIADRKMLGILTAYTEMGAADPVYHARLNLEADAAEFACPPQSAFVAARQYQFLTDYHPATIEQLQSIGEDLPTVRSMVEAQDARDASDALFDAATEAASAHAAPAW
ncbi:hypothetical protein [Glacieibacterium sp.]|uniref:hypothetical protein n=1 Tax=Glacieibacterium sp. TaxID=2860237 RepID=UPI003AFFB35D